MSASEIVSGIRAGERSASDVVAAALERAREVDEVDALNVFLSRAEKRARKRVERLDEDGRLVKDAPLLGVPFAAKDNIAVLGLPVTCGSRVLEDYVTPYTATAIDRLE